MTERPDWWSGLLGPRTDTESLTWGDLWRRVGLTRLPAPPEGVTVDIPGFEGVRLTIEQAEESLVAAADRLALPQSNWSIEDFNVLAVSGGAAGGAYGAGVMVGLSRAGKRPTYAIVTGVSTGALIAPFAFLGSEWDDRLTEAYTGGYASRLINIRGLAPAFGPGVFGPEALDNLIFRFIDEAVMDAVAREHRLGRRLLVATTDLDSQRASIWDMGEIAARGGAAALALFREVLGASASLPGLFAPRRIRFEADGVAYEEMHVDGGVAAPLFVMPEALLRWKNVGSRLNGGRVFVLVNTVLAQGPRTTQTNLASVLIRSFDTMLRFSYRQAISVAATFCMANNLPLGIASIAGDIGNGSMLNFDTTNMRKIFDAAVERAAGDDLWATPSPVPED